MSERGTSRRRVEDDRFLRGAGRFVDDMVVAGALHGVVLRSPHAHARIMEIATGAAAAMPGVAAIFTADDLASVGHLPCVAKVATTDPLIVPPRPALAEKFVRHVGDPVAFVVADTVDAARDAAEAIVVEYEILPAVTDAVAARAADAPLLWPQAPRNVAFRFEKGDRAGVAAAFAGAAHVVELELFNNRVCPAALEPRSAIALYDPKIEVFTLYLTGQGVHGIRGPLAEQVFRVPLEKIQVVAPDVGGGFGAKNFVYPEWVMLLFAARALGRPVRWRCERSEDFLSSAQGRDNRTVARLAIDEAGIFLALEVKTTANLGAYMSHAGPGSSTNAPGTAMGGLYAIPAIHMDVHGVFTNTVPIDAYRGAGKPEANYIIERLIDRAARQIGEDRVELRRKNFMKKFPYRTGLGTVIDCGAFAETLEQVVADADFGGFAARRVASAERGMLRGLGICGFLETSRGAPGEMAGIRFEANGQVALVLGTQSNGQGHETSFAQIAADLLGLDHSCFRLVQADTRTVPRGQGHGGARSMHMGGAALVMAIDAVIRKGRGVAARLLQCAAEEVRFGDGVFVAPGGGRVGLLAAAAADDLDVIADSTLDLITFPSGCHAAEVEIDPETGRVSLVRYVARDDYGTLINPMLTEGQVQGGLAQGIGQALFEDVVHDPQSGQPLSASLMDYALPQADHLPHFDIGFLPVPTSSNPLGVKGAGQAGCISAPPTVMNAVLDALAPLGIEQMDMPATAQKVWSALKSARQPAILGEA
jgi:carbon-monoxide dehydrogenase large subunit